MKKPDKFDLDVQSVQCTLDALDVVREAFDERHRTWGLSKKEFADWIGRDPSYVSRILNGRASNVNYQTLARMLAALQFYPELTKCELFDLPVAPNALPRDYFDDNYVRAVTPSWTVLLSGDGEEISTKKSGYSKSVTVHE